MKMKALLPDIAAAQAAVDAAIVQQTTASTARAAADRQLAVANDVLYAAHLALEEARVARVASRLPTDLAARLVAGTLDRADYAALSRRKLAKKSGIGYHSSYHLNGGGRAAQRWLHKQSAADEGNAQCTTRPTAPERAICTCEERPDAP